MIDSHCHLTDPRLHTQLDDVLARAVAAGVEHMITIGTHPADWGAFKTPTLREIANTGPYMHDGRFKTLEEVVDFYDKGGIPNKNLDKIMKPLKLTAGEKKELVAFLNALSGEGWNIPEPVKFPE